MKSVDHFMENLDTNIKHNVYLFTKNYTQINTYLEDKRSQRKNKNAFLQESVIDSIVSHLDLLFNLAPRTTTDMIVYRHLDLSFINEYQQNINYRDTYKGFLIASSDKPKNCCILKILVPAGSKMVNIKYLSEYPDENLEFEILKVSKRLFGKPKITAKIHN